MDLESDVVPGRLELPTSTLSVWRSNQLSYRTGFKLSAYVPELSFIFLYGNKQHVVKKQRASDPNLLVCSSKR